MRVTRWIVLPQKFEKNLPLCFEGMYEVIFLNVDDFFQLLWPSHNIRTLYRTENLQNSHCAAASWWRLRSFK